MCADRYEALQPLHQAAREVFGHLEADVAEGVRLRHDNGPQFVSEDYQDEIAFLGIDSSPAYVREPEGNGCSERFIRTLKEQLLWLETFETIDELQAALQAFKDRFNHEWLVQRHGYRTPSQVRADLTQHHLGRAA